MCIPIFDLMFFSFFFFNDTATTEIYTLSLHDALPILRDDEASGQSFRLSRRLFFVDPPDAVRLLIPQDRKSTRLNSSHTVISYAVFCLKKKKKKITNSNTRINQKITHKTIKKDNCDVQ